MVRLLFFLLTTTLALVITSSIVPGISIENFFSALLAVIAIGFLNVFLKPFLLFLTLPANLLTFGLFSWVISAIILWLASLLVSGFAVDGFLSALVGGVIFAFFSSLLHTLLK